MRSRHSAGRSFGGDFTDQAVLKHFLHILRQHFKVNNRAITYGALGIIVTDCVTYHSRFFTSGLIELHDFHAGVANVQAEQYIPIPLESLYLDYDISKNDTTGVDLLVVATPKNIVDSTIKFVDSMGFEPVALEPTMNATARMFKFDDLSRGEPSLFIDFGSIAIDIAVFDQGMFVNSTVSGGSDTLTNLVAKKLNITPSEAYIIKSQYGVGPGSKMHQVMAAAQPILEPMVREARKTMRYFEERAPSRHRKINKIIVTGGGASLRGLDEYLSRQLGIPAQRLNPWPNIDFGDLQPPTELASSMYVTAAGEAVLNFKEIFS